MKKSLLNLCPIALTLIFCLSPLFSNASSKVLINTKNIHVLKADPPGKKKRKKRKKSMYAKPDRLFTKGQWDATLGIGTIPTFVMDGASIKLLPIQVGTEYRFGEKFSIGATVGHSISESQPQVISDGLQVSWTNRFYNFALRPAVHITRIEKWDFYGGFSAGIQVSDIKGKGVESEEKLRDIKNHLGIHSNTNGTLSGFTGVRYVVSPKWTVGGEVGFGISIFTIGVTHMINKVTD